MTVSIKICFEVPDVNLLMLPVKCSWSTVEKDTVGVQSHFVDFVYFIACLYFWKQFLKI